MNLHQVAFPLGGAWGLPWLVCAMAVYVYGLGGGHMFEHNAPPPLGGAWGLPWLVCAMAVYVYGLGGAYVRT